MKGQLQHSSRMNAKYQDWPHTPLEESAASFQETLPVYKPVEFRRDHSRGFTQLAGGS
jgi:hypothetical protein